jgi:hypothetical protein
MHTGTTSVLEFTSRTRSGGCATCVSIGLAAAIACAPVTVALAQGTPAARNNQQGQTEAQRQPTPGRLIVPIAGTLGSAQAPAPSASSTQEPVAAAAGPVTGSFAIQRFARTTEDAVAAVGTLTLSFTDPASNQERTIITQVAMPLAMSPNTASPGATAATAQACGTLSLALGPLDLNLLGHAFQLERANVDLTVVQGAGDRLGSLLCDVTGQIDGGSRSADVIKTLNTLLDTIG